MNEAMRNKDVQKLRKFVVYAFEEINAGRILSPREDFFEINSIVKPSTSN
jgi:hypothetical protein